MLVNIIGTTYTLTQAVNSISVEYLLTTARASVLFRSLYFVNQYNYDHNIRFETLDLDQSIFQHPITTSKTNYKYN